LQARKRGLPPAKTHWPESAGSAPKEKPPNGAENVKPS